jgi:hypothetical protein
MAIGTNIWKDKSTDMHIDQVLTNTMVEKAVVECARINFAGNVRRLRQSLLEGQCEYCRCLSENLVAQICEYLGQLDTTVKAVYHYEPLDVSQPATSLDTSKAHNGINLIVWVNRKSAALGALVNTLEVSLAASQRQLGCINATPACFTLDVTMVDDHDIQERRGLGLLVDNYGLRSQRVWQRASQTDKIPIEPLPEARREKYALPEMFDLDLIPESRLLEHAAKIENAPPQDRAALEYHLTELKVSLIRRMVSDHLAYINIAKRWFSVSDLAEIYRHRIGFGRIGGKSAGMLLAVRILEQVADEELKAHIRIPESYFLGSDLMYIFMAMNGLTHWNNQKYKPEDQIRAEYTQIREEYLAGDFPPEVILELKTILEKLGPHPLIVRSSSQLEDNFGTSFAGKYDSFFCANQGTPEENLNALTKAIACTYASTYNPDALLYRHSKGLQDYDERMAVLIQAVQGEQWGRYFLPFGAGVAFSRNIYRWTPQIRREDGFARLVWGLGTRAVERVGNDYPRPVALSHPTLHPDDSPEAIRYYSQQYVDVIDLQENTFKTLLAHEVLKANYPPLRFLVQIEQDGYFSSPRSRVMTDQIKLLAITFDGFLQRTPFATRLSQMLRLLEQHCLSAVDVEFTARILDPNASPPEVEICVLQCRPHSSLQVTERVHVPPDLALEDIVFSSHFIVPQGYLKNIRHVIFVPAERYFSLSTAADRNQLSRIIGRLNKALGKKAFICVGPGRWGTTTHDLGVYVGYADICNAGALVELSGQEIGPAPEPSLGTHFFQDLMEAQIYPVAIPLDDVTTIFNSAFFYKTPNALRHWTETSDNLVDCVKVIDVAAARPGHHLDLIMDDEKSQTVAYFVPDG